MDWFMLLAQGVGLLAFAISVFALYQKDDRKHKILMGFMAVTQSIHFLFLGALAGAAFSFIGSIRFFTSHFFREKWFGYLLLFANCLILSLIYEKWTDIFVLVAATCITVGYFHFNGISMRIFTLGSVSCWLVYSVIHGSIGNSLAQILMMVVNVQTIYRLKKEPTHV